MFLISVRYLFVTVSINSCDRLSIVSKYIAANGIQNV